MTIEKILEIKNELVDQGIIKPEINDSKLFLKLFEELKEWFKWDIQRFPYKELDNPIGYHYNYNDNDLKFYNENYDLIVFSVMLGIYICAKEECLSDIEITNGILRCRFTSFNTGKDRYFYENYQKICGINIDNLGYFIRGMIRNKMGNGTFEAFEEFLNNYITILQKHKPVPLINKDGTIETTETPVDESVVTNKPQVTPPVVDDKDGTIETTATPVDESVVTDKPQVTPVAPTYQLNYNADPYAKVRAKFGFVPLAYVALQYNPVGCWFYDNQLGIYRSQFVDYHKLNCMADKVTARKYIESITKIMSNPVIYEEILQHMPIVGTKFKDTEPVLLKFISGSSIYSTKYAIGCQYNEHSLVFVCDVITNTVNVSYFGKSADVSDAVNNFRV